MGLDWFVLPKKENGRDVMPHETAGRIILDRNDPVSIEKFGQLHAQRLTEISEPGAPPAAPPEPRGLARIGDRLSGRDRLRRESFVREERKWRRMKASHEYWHRPLETVLEDAFSDLDNPDGKEKWVLADAADDRLDALAQFLGTGGPYDFRSNELREDLNCVTAFAAQELGYDYDVFIASDLTPDEMLQMAEDMEDTLSKFRDSGADLEDGDVQLGIEITESAVRYLRFWGGHGHGLQADW